MNEHELLIEFLRRATYWPRDKWWLWRMKPGGKACGAWIRLVRDMWIADMWAADGDEELADAAASALDSIYSFMRAHDWMDIDSETQRNPGGNTLPDYPAVGPTVADASYWKPWRRRA